MAEELWDMSDGELCALLSNLSSYADRKMSRHWWAGHFSTRGAVPLGIESDAIAADAIVDYLKGERKWDKMAYPDLEAFLRGAVDSMISHLVRSRENRRTRTLQADIASSSEADDTDDESKDALFQKLRLVVNARFGLQDIVTQVFQCVAEGLSRSQISTKLSITTADVTNAKKRLRCALMQYAREEREP